MSDGSLEGLIVIDKPVGPTSFDVIRGLRRVLRTRALGHTGTLDPAASGVLCVAVGWSLKLLRYLPHERKVYEAVVALGQTTDTDDAAGRVVAERPVAVGTDALAQALEALTGDIDQRPPAYSALHVDGERAYAKARRGETVELAPRAVRVERIEVLWQELPRLGLRVTCGPGTYIRSLARDLGEMLGCGGHLAALRRTVNGPFSIERAQPLDALVAGRDAPSLLSSSEMLAHCAPVLLATEELARIRLGQRLALPDGLGAHPGDLLRIVDAGGMLQVVAEVGDEGRGPFLQPVRVRPPGG